MNKDIYEVTRIDYISFIEQLKSECYHVKNILNDNINSTQVWSNKNNKLLCERYSDNHIKNERYYIFEMPDDDERKPPIPKYKLHLNTKEDVQAFFNIVSKLSGDKHD